MIGHFKTLAAAIVTMLVGPPIAASVEFPVEAEGEMHRSVDLPSEAGDSPNVMGDIV